jgi:signal transduction histidine kinase
VTAWFRPTVRLRLAALYAAAFFISGVVLLVSSYLLVRHNLLDRASEPAHRLPGGHFGRDSDAIFDEARREVRAAALRQLVDRYILVLALTTLLSALLGWLMAGRALRPLKRITATARRVSEENLHERIALEGPQDELRELADTFDTMLTRLDAAFASQRSFIANASHELRTPLAVIRAEVDVALASRDLTKEKLVEMARVVRVATERSEQLIEGLLTLARSDRGDLSREAVELRSVAALAMKEESEEIERRGLRVESTLGPAVAAGDRALVERLVANLIQNGVRYSDAGGLLSVSTFTDNGHAVLRVANGGPAITQEEALTLATPFRRLRRERTGSSAGSGLGLSIVQSVVEAHGGTMEIVAPGKGLVVIVRMPGRLDRRHQPQPA